MSGGAEERQADCKTHRLVGEVREEKARVQVGRGCGGTKGEVDPQSPHGEYTKTPCFI